MKIFLISVAIIVWGVVSCGVYRSIQEQIEETKARKAGILCETWNPDDSFLATFTKPWVVERHRARHHEHPYGLPPVDVCDDEDFPIGGGTHGMLIQ